MAIIPNDRVHTIGNGVHHSEGVLVDRDGNVIGFGRDHGAYRVSADGVTERFAELPEGTIPNGASADGGRYHSPQYRKVSASRLS